MPYAKTLVGVVTAVLAAIVPGLTGGPMGLPEYVNVVVLAAGAIQVYNAANIPQWRYAKTIAYAVAAGGVVLLSALSDGDVSTSEWVQIVIAVLGTGGVYAAPGPRHSLPRAA